jgi:hypothetical protein
MTTSQKYLSITSKMQQERAILQLNSMDSLASLVC